MVLLASIAAVIGLAACSGGGAKQSVKLELASVSVLPPEIQQAEPKVREAYQFAVANQDYLTNFPCYCGCGGMGHKSNRDCYIDEVKPDGTIVFEKHAFFCGVCVDITRDVMRMTEQGKSAKEIRAYIDATYSKFGPPTDTEPVK